MISQIKFQTVQTEPNGFTIFAPNLTEEGISLLLQKLQELNGAEIKNEDSSKLDVSNFVLSLRKEQSISMNLQFKEIEEPKVTQQDERINELEQKMSNLIQKVEFLQNSEKNIIESKPRETLEETEKVDKTEKQIQTLTEKLNTLSCQKRKAIISEKIETLKIKQQKEKENKKIQKIEKRIEILTEKFNSSLPEKRKIGISDKLSILKEQLELSKNLSEDRTSKSSLPCAPLFDVEKFIQQKKTSKVEHKKMKIEKLEQEWMKFKLNQK